MGSFGLPALAIKPPEQTDALGEVGKLAQLQGALQQRQAGQISLQQQQQALSDQQAATKAMHEWDGKDFTQLPSLMLKHGASAQAVIGMKQHILTQQETLSKMAQQDAETGSKNVATTAAKNNLALGQLQTLNDVPDDQLAQQLSKVSGDLANAGLIDPQHAQAAQQLAQLPAPQLRKALALYEKSMMGQKEQFDQAQEQLKTGATVYKDTQQGNEANISTQQKQAVLAGTSPTGVTAAQQQEQQSRAQQLKIEAQRNWETQRHNKMSEAQLTPDALDMAAQQFASTGQMPNVGRGGAVRSQIMNAASAKYPAIDLASNAAAYKANQQSLEGLQKNLDSVTAFESTANKNLDLFLTSAKKIVDTGSPLLNKPLRAINQNVLGSADQAAVNAARQVAVNEIAKVTGNPGLSGQLSDSARKEVSDFNPANATLAQTYKVAQVLKQDMANRHQSYSDQIGAIQQRLKNSTSGGQGAQQQSQPAEAAPMTATGPNGHKIMLKGNQWVDAQTGAPIQ